jgi:DNA-binding PadR family transcriptional regulator
MYEKQKKYLKTEKGKEALLRCREKPEHKERKRLYDQVTKHRRNETANLRYYYNSDPLPAVRNLFIRV